MARGTRGFYFSMARGLLKRKKTEPWKRPKRSLDLSERTGVASQVPSQVSRSLLKLFTDSSGDLEICWKLCVFLKVLEGSWFFFLSGGFCFFGPAIENKMFFDRRPTEDSNSVPKAGSTEVNSTSIGIPSWWRIGAEGSLGRSRDKAGLRLGFSWGFICCWSGSWWLWLIVWRFLVQFHGDRPKDQWGGRPKLISTVAELKRLKSFDIVFARLLRKRGSST